MQTHWRGIKNQRVNFFLQMHSAKEGEEKSNSRKQEVVVYSQKFQKESIKKREN